jgi:glutaconate CoA-transferase subunit B
LTPTSNDWALDRHAECSLDIEELFDLAASGRMQRMFLSGLQIDAYGNANVTRLGSDTLRLPLPGGGGGCNLSCDVGNFTLWTTAHRGAVGKDGRRMLRLVQQCDFVTSLGHRGVDGSSRAQLGHQGGGPDCLVTDLGLFDYDAEGHARLRSVYTDTTREEVALNTGFALRSLDVLEPMPMPDAQAVAIIRALDPLQVHRKELRPADNERRFPLAA